MPIIAVVAAIGADVVAGAAVAATAGGIAAISTVTAFEVVAAVGATIGAVGAVTRDKALSYAGLAIGAIGGIGALASSAGLLGADAASGAPLFAQPAASTADVAPAAANNTIINGQGDTIVPPTGAASSGTVAAVANGTLPPADPNAVSPATADNPMAPAPAPAPAAANNTILNGQGDTIVPPTGAAANAPSTPMPPSGAAPSVPAAPTSAPLSSGSSPAVAGVDPFGGNTLGTTAAAGSGASSDNPLSGLLAFANKNPAVTMGAVMAAGQFISGATSTLTPAQVTALNAQAASNNAAAGLTNLQASNMAQPKASVVSAPVTGAPQQLVPQQAAPTSPVTGVPAGVASGLINGAQPAAVTGVPA